MMIPAISLSINVAVSATDHVMRQLQNSSSPSGDDDDDIIPRREDLVYFCGSLTAATASYAGFVGITGLLFNLYPLEGIVSKDFACGLGRHCPCHWGPTRLFSANVFGCASSIFALIIGCLLHLRYPSNSFFLYVGVVVNCFSVFLCAVAAKQLIQPRIQFRGFLTTLYADL